MVIIHQPAMMQGKTGDIWNVTQVVIVLVVIWMAARQRNFFLTIQRQVLKVFLRVLFQIILIQKDGMTHLIQIQMVIRSPVDTLFQLRDMTPEALDVKKLILIVLPSANHRNILCIAR